MKMLCRLDVHRFKLFKAYRLAPSVVYQVRCTRCGKVQNRG